VIHDSFASRRLIRLAAALVLTLAVAYAIPAAQTPAKKILTVDDYTRWRSINGAELSGDGSWAAYDLQYTNTLPADAKPVLHLLRLDTNQDIEIPNATGGDLAVAKLRELPVALQRREILKWLRLRKIANVGFDVVESIRSLLDHTVAKVNLPQDRHVRRRAGKIFIE